MKLRLGDSETNLRRVQSHVATSIGGQMFVKLKASGTPAGQPQTLNFIGATITPVGDGSEVNITTGGGGFTLLTATETVDGSRTTFTFASATSQPNFIVQDGAMMRATTSRGTVNWTWNSGTKVATMSIPPQDDIAAIQ